MFEEQVGWAVEAGVDYVVGETFTWGEEALLGTRGDQGDGPAGGDHVGRSSGRYDR